MTATILSVLEAASSVQITPQLVKQTMLYERRFVNQNPEHLAFFGGNLMGVHPLRFKSTDRELWLNEIVEMDELDVEDGLKHVHSLDPNWVRANDVMNLSCLWLAHKFMTDPKLSNAQKEEGATAALLVLQYKFLGSLMAHFYPYPADEASMLATYAELSRKFALKAAGSWGALLTQRAKELLSPRSIHYRTLITFGSDKDLIYMVSDIQGRLREIVKSMTTVFYQVRERGNRIGTDRATFDVDGELVMQDKSRHHSAIIKYIHDVVDDKPSFIKPELLALIADAMHTMSPKLLEESLEWMSRNYHVRGHDKLQELVSETLLYAFDLIASDRALYAKGSGITPLLTKLRALYMASRMSDPVLLRTKTLSEWAVTHAISSKNPSVIASVRTGLQMYIVVRALAMKYYQS